jgi:hypothetical protein
MVGFLEMHESCRLDGNTFAGFTGTVKGQKYVVRENSYLGGKVYVPGSIEEIVLRNGYAE